MSKALEQEVRRLQEELQLSNQRLLEATKQLARLADASNRVSTNVAVMCEASMAGDIVLVMSKVEQFTQDYMRHRKPMGSVH